MDQRYVIDRATRAQAVALLQGMAADVPATPEVIERVVDRLMDALPLEAYTPVRLQGLAISPEAEVVIVALAA